MQQHDSNRFAHSIIAAAVGTIANRPEEVSNFDRLAIVAGSALEQSEANTAALVDLRQAVEEGNKETHRLLRAIANGNGNGHGNGNGRRFHRARQFGPPALAGGGVFGFLEFIKILVGGG